MPRKPTYDSRCYDLAEVFLSDEEGLNTDHAKAHLAAHIQEAIESEIEWMRDRKQTINQEETNPKQG
jgi:hypothetical protein